MITRVRGKTPGGENKMKSLGLDKLAAEINKQFGNSLKMGSEHRQPVRIPTGIFTLDMALCGGVFVRCINGFFGRRSSGKTTTMLKTIASAQRMYPDGIVAYIDAELTFDPVWAEKLGVDTDRLLVAQPTSGEEAVDVAQAFMEHPAICMVCLDSIAALVPMKEVEAAAEDAHVGIHAKLVTRLVRKINAGIANAAKQGRDITFLYTNQDRAGIGKWAPAGQEAISNPGGKALEHYSVLQVKFKNKETLKKDEEGIEMLDVNEHAFTIDKNKFNAGIRKGEFQLQRVANEEYGLDEGDIDDAASMLAFGKKMGIYTGAGRSWTLDMPDFNETKGSADEWIKFLYEEREYHQQLRNHLIALHAVKLGMPQYLIDNIYEQA